MSGIKQKLVGLVGHQTFEEWRRDQHSGVLSMTDELIRVPDMVESILYEQRTRALTGLLDRPLLCMLASVLDGQPAHKATRILRSAERFVKAIEQKRIGKNLCPWEASEKETQSNQGMDPLQLELHECRVKRVIPPSLRERLLLACDAQEVATETMGLSLMAAA